MSINDFVHGKTPRLPPLPSSPGSQVDDQDDGGAIMEAEMAIMQAEMAAALVVAQAGTRRPRDKADELRIRDENRAEAATMVVRAIQRAGRDPTIVTPNDAAIIWILADFLAKVCDQPLPAIDPAFAAGKRASSAENALVEQAMRHDSQMAANDSAA